MTQIIFPEKVIYLGTPFRKKNDFPDGPVAGDGHVRACHALRRSQA